eukprot:TRINITY_DN3760_c0_g1_i2.p1 TRINITY_DN3760_c0_g1~~TRINITY_DN3760_c0_g1_i2.p1  ORF type:complete len:131 (+),score=32.04 TRINITY_DN3760_c0_g1_i2:226-618(+)
MATPAAEFAQPIRYFDIHVYYELDKSAEVSNFRDLLQETFPDMRVFDLVNRPIGPHPLPMFEGHIYTPEQFSRFVPWLCLNHQDFSILVHPNTDDAVADHTGSAIWIGKQLDLNIALMEQMLRQMGRFRK